MLKRILLFTYGSLSYLIFLGTFLYAVCFVGNFGVPRTLDGAASGPLGVSFAIDAGLLALFAVQHSVMARKWFKEWWTRIVPKPVERSTYVLFSSLALILLFTEWRPLGGVIWSVEDPVGRLVLWGLFAFGWGLVLFSTFLINHFDLFGLRQVWLHLLNRPYNTLRFATPGPYRLVRHPLYVGWLFAFWMTPTMTLAHLLFSVATTAYILLAIRFEERDLVREHGEAYEEYRRTVPMLVPFTGKRGPTPGSGIVREELKTIRKFLCLSLTLSLALVQTVMAQHNSRPQEPQAGAWRTYVLTSGAELPLPAPPRPASAQTRAELAELRALEAQRTPVVQAAIDFWNAQPAFKPWTELQLELIRTRSINPPRAHRGLALVHVAIYDAIIAAWHWKYTYHRLRPDRLDRWLTSAVEPPLHPTYPSEHAVIAGAAERMLSYLFEADAEMIRQRSAEAALSRLQAGVNYRSDIEAGLELGRAVAEMVIARRAVSDGGDAQWDCVTQPGRLIGPGFWEPTSAPFNLCPPAGRTPTEPFAGQWQPWVIASTSDFPAPPPPGFSHYGTDQAAVCEVFAQPARELIDQVALTRAEPSDGPRNALIARWAGPPSTRWNLILLELLARDGLNLPRAARIGGLLNVALADSLYTSWQAKYTYWTARPQTLIRQCGFDPSFASVRATPRDPSYISGNATCGGAAGKLLAFFFPRDAATLRAEAVGGGISRLYDGTHWRFEIEAGAEIGRQMAPLFIERAMHDGAHPPR